MFKSTLEKLDYLLNLDTEKQEIDFHIVRQLSNDTDAEVRSQCAETLALIPCEESRIVLQMASNVWFRENYSWR